MKKRSIFAVLPLLMCLIMPVSAATWVAADRVAPVGAKILNANGLPAGTKFKVVNGAADNSLTATTNVVQVSSTELSYAGNDNEVAAATAHEMALIINGKGTKDKLRNIAKTAITNTFTSDSAVTAATNSEFVSTRVSLSDKKTADITAADLMIKAGYNPLAVVVWVTKQPGSTLEALQGKPSNSERAMYVYDYLTYNYPDKVKAGYGCQEYRNFLAYADPIVQDRNSNKKKLAKFNKEQEKNKKLRAKEINQYKATGTSGWDSSYAVLKALSEQATGGK